MVNKILIGLGAVLLFGAAFLWYLGDKTLASQPTVVNTDNGLKKLVYPDTDSDGLPDWEEELWQTEKKNPDTDGDGVTDGEEIQLGRDPRGDDPGAQLVEPEEKMAVIVRNAVTGKDSPLASPQSSQFWQPVVSYKADDLNTADTKSEAAIKKYGEEVRTILYSYSVADEGNELQMLLTYVDQRSTDSLQKLQRSVENHRQTSKKLLAIEVPISAQTQHLSLLNSFVALTETIYNMAQVTTEPVLALENGQLYPTRFLLVLHSVVGLNKYFTEQSVTFDSAHTPRLLIDF